MPCSSWRQLRHQCHFNVSAAQELQLSADMELPETDTEWLWFLWRMLPLSLRFYKVYFVLFFWLCPVLQLGSWAWLCIKGVNSSLWKPPWWASGATTSCGQALEITQDQRRMWWGTPAFQIQGVPGEHLPQSHSQLDSKTSLAQSTAGSSNSSDLPFLILCGTLPSQNTMQNDYKKTRSQP